MSEHALQDWRVTGLSGLAGLTAEDLPAFEILYLDSLAAHVMASGELQEPYTVEDGTQVVAFLLRAIATARSYRPSPAPALSHDLVQAREAVVTGAHAFAARGRSGLSQLVNRLIPAAVGELELRSGSAEQQVQSLFRFGLLAVASGPANQLSTAAAEGIDEILLAWDELIGAGFVPPWRVPVRG